MTSGWPFEYRERKLFHDEEPHVLDLPPAEITEFLMQLISSATNHHAFTVSSQTHTR